MKNPVRLLVRAACVFFATFALQSAFANNYYFSSTDGNDNRPAHVVDRPNTPWKSLAKLNAIFSTLQAGDTIFFKRGDVFNGSINISASGSGSAPIVLTAYGTGDKPVISGFTTFTDWTSLGSNRWQTNAAMVDRMNVVVVNGVFQPIGRWPNASAAAGGYLTVESHSGNTSVTSNVLASSTNWTGGEVVIRKNRWILDANKITSQNGNTISYTSESGYHASDGYGFFIQNHAGALDAQGEWYQGGGKLGVYLSGNPSAYTIEGSTTPVLVSASAQNHIQFYGLSFTGANNNSFELRNAAGISIINCSIANTGVNAIDASGCNGLRLEGNSISRTGNIGLNLAGCSGASIRSNSFSNTGAVAGMGKGGDGTYEAILISGDGNLVEENSIENTGYIPITFSGSSVTIKNNYINGFGLVKDDGGGIYTWNNSNNPPTYTARKITGNIVLNGKTAKAGTNETAEKFSHGVYLDDNAANVEVSGNTVANCEGFGIYVHNARDNSITGNTAYNNTVQIALVHDDIAPNYPIRNTTLNNNTFFALQPSQLTAEFKSRANDIGDFGLFENNRYQRPLDDNATIGVLKNVNGAYSYQLLDVEGWQSLYGKDAGSKASPKTFAPYQINSVATNNKFGNGSFGSNIGGLYAFSSANNCQTAWRSGELDGGSLAVSFSNLTGNSKGTIVMGAGAFSTGKRYLLKFSVKGPAEQKMLEVYLRKSGSPYNDITERKLVKVKSNRTEAEVLFTVNESTSDGSIGIDVPEHSGAVHFDNIDLREVSASEINVADSIRFSTNPGVTTNLSAGASWIDVNGVPYAGNVSLSPYTSQIVLAGNPTTVVTNPPVNCSATGNILYERWTGVGGNTVAQNASSQPPSLTGNLSLFEGVRDGGDNYASRIRGYLCPPQSGTYTFYISGDDGTELWLSSSDDPSTKTRIAYSVSWTSFREWNKYTTQKSAAIFLEAGKKYYIEALHKEGGGGDHLSVAWTLPGGVMEAPIPGSRLSPFTPVSLQSQAINFPTIPDIILGSNSSISLNASASSGLPVTYTLVSGGATLNGNLLTGLSVGIITIKAAQPGNSQFAAAAEVTQTVVIVPAPVAVVQCSATGSILREQWNGVSGNDIAQVPASAAPSSSSQLTSFETGQNLGEAYASRLRGYICPPQTGTYTFYIAGDDATELWLSSDESLTNKTKIAYSIWWTDYRQWNKYSTQKSASIFLQAGKKYYIEALQKEGNGGDHLSVAWTLPNGTLEAPIAGSRLSPYVPPVSTTQCSATGAILLEQWTDIRGNDVAQVPQMLTPNRTAQINKIELDQNGGDNYASRIRGYLCPPQSGSYTFHISGDDATELWLSSSDDPSTKTRIAYSVSWTSFREWNKYTTQKSAAIFLEAGKKYYIEALHKEGGGGDHLSVAWTLPDGNMEAPIGSSRISAFTSPSPKAVGAAGAAGNNKTSAPVVEVVNPPAVFAVTAYPNPVANTTTVTVSTAKAGQASIRLTDATGKAVKQIFTGMLQVGGAQRFLVDMSNLAKGVFFLRVSTAEGVVTQKLIKS